MISFPHAKINLGLYIVSKRPDGFHNLETIFYPLPLRDALEVIPSDKFSFNPSGLPISVELKDNLVFKAYALIRKKFPHIPAVDIYLHKAIPMGAGLGGGSSDAAAMIQTLAKIFDLPLGVKEAAAMAAGLGSDCTFFMQNSPCYGNGRGEILEPVNLDLSDYSFLLVHPDIKIGTGWAYSQIRPAPARNDLRKAILEPVSQWPGLLANDFETVVFAEFPRLGQIKEQLYAAGALYAAMTGSGSTLFGIFGKDGPPAFEVGQARISRINGRSL